MSYIDKLRIQGIRAFPTGCYEVIRFDRPLTIIAGINGSGKTTIIETLRFVTTGGLPPNAATKGLWIHDPGLEHVTKVAALAQLVFHSGNGTKVTAGRRLELEVKKKGQTTTRSQKQLECSLVVEKVAGESFKGSTRAGDLDLLLPKYLGVSQSLLDNVIFCHQESSTWPLDVSAVLKEKFDEIFEAGKYTKAVKELDEIRKKHRTNLTQQTELANSAKKDRDRARKAEKQMTQLQEAINTLHTNHDEMKPKIAQLDEERRDFRARADQYGQKLVALQNARSRANQNESLMAGMLEYLNEAEESDDELRNLLRQFDRTKARHQDQQEAKTDEYLQYKKDGEDLAEQLNAKLTARGQLEQAKHAYEERIKQRKERISESARQHKIRGYDDLDDERNVEEFLFKIRKMKKESANKAQKATDEWEKSKQEARVQINQLTASESVLKEKRATASKNVAVANRNAQAKQADADAIAINEGDQAVMKSRMKQLREALVAANDYLTSKDFTSKITKAEAELNKSKTSRKTIDAELNQAHSRAAEFAELELVSKEIKEKNQSLKTLQKAHDARISTILNQTWTVKKLDSLFKEKQLESANKVESAKKDRDGADRQAEQVQYKLKTARDTLKNYEAEVKRCAKKVQDVTGEDISEYKLNLQEAEVQLGNAQEAIEASGGLAKYFEEVLKVAETKEACRLCERAFKGPTDQKLVSMKKKLQSLIARSDLEQAKEDLETATDNHKQITEVGISYETYMKLTEQDVPNVEKDVAKLSKEYDTFSQQIEEHDRAVEEAETAQKEVDSIGAIVLTITKTSQDIDDRERKLEGLKERQSQTHGGGFRTVSDIQTDRDNIDDRLDEQEKAKKRLEEEYKVANDNVIDKERDISKLERDFSTARTQLDKKQNILARVEEFKAEAQKQKDSLEEKQQQLEQIKPEIDAATNKYEDIRIRASADLKSLSEAASEMANTVNLLDTISSEIDNYISSGSDTKLAQILAQIDLTKQNIGKIEESKTKLTKEINAIAEKVRDSENLRRHYSDNLKYRDLQRAVEEARAEIQRLEDSNTEADKNELEAQANRKSREYDKLSMSLEGIRGEWKAKDDELGRLVKEYNVDLKDAAKRYREAHVRAESTKAAIDDIGRYSTALSKAVGDYHTIKMDQVNGLVEELWQATYKGTDVDRIYIKSDYTETKTTKSHNYRVVMLKRDVELDMRGRCSAGQKVLACIIIRLALAECFSQNCGVIALDEPTTNLDEQNVEALARALHALILRGQAQENFQVSVLNLLMLHINMSKRSSSSHTTNTS